MMAAVNPLQLSFCCTQPCLCANTVATLVVCDSARCSRTLEQAPSSPACGSATPSWGDQRLNAAAWALFMHADVAPDVLRGRCWFPRWFLEPSSSRQVQYRVQYCRSRHGYAIRAAILQSGTSPTPTSAWLLESTRPPEPPDQSPQIRSDSGAVSRLGGPSCSSVGGPCRSWAPLM